MLDDLLDEYDEPDDEGSAAAVLGIDLGTTNSVAAAIIDGAVVLIRDEKNNSLHPSVVAWLPDGSRSVGAAAHHRRTIDPDNTVFSAKRIIGHPYTSSRVQTAIKQLPYRLSKGANEEVMVETREGPVSVTTVASYVLGYLKEMAERQLGTQITHCVVTVPANFSDSQRFATRRAAEMADMAVLRILNEPTAAAIAYGQSRRIHQRIAIFDLGGGTFDVTILAVRDNLFEVLGTGGDPFLGGDDVDEVIYALLAKAFLKKHRIDANVDPIAKARLRMAAEQIKRGLSEQESVSGTLNEVSRGAGGKPLGLEFSLSREQLNKLISPLVESTIATTLQVLETADVAPQLVDEIILVGGSTRIPQIRDKVQEVFGKVPRLDINPMEVVAIGAALQAERMQNPGADQGVLLDVTPHSLRIATVAGYSQVLVAKNSTIPAEGTKTFFTAKDDQETVRIKVAQGEDEKFDDNALMGELRLDELPVGQRGTIGVRVTFTIDADGILQISAQETSSNTSTQAVLSVMGLEEER